MSIYGEFDSRFRPRPAVWRVVLVSFCQMVLAVWITNTLVSTGDMAIWRAAKTDKAWIAEAAPWTTAKAELVRLLRPVNEDLAFAYDRQYHHLEVFAAGALLILAVIFGFFVTRQTLAARLFFLRFAQTLAIFGGAAFPLRKCFLWNCSLAADEVPQLAAIGVVALSITIFAQWRANEILFGNRFGNWFLQIVPAAAAIGFASQLAIDQTGIFAAAAFVGITLIATVTRRPKPHYEQLGEPEMSGATAGLVIVTVAVVAASWWTFGFRPLREPRAVIIDLQERRIQIEPWRSVAAKLPSFGPAPATSPQNIEIHYTTPAERARRKRPSP